MTLLGHILDGSLFKLNYLEFGIFEPLEVLLEGGCDPLGTVCLGAARVQ